MLFSCTERILQERAEVHVFSNRNFFSFQPKLKTVIRKQLINLISCLRCSCVYLPALFEKWFGELAVLMEVFPMYNEIFEYFFIMWGIM